MARKNQVNLADEFMDDIKKNLQSWMPKGNSVFYLTTKNWYQFRKNGDSINCVRQDIATTKVDRASIRGKSIPIGRDWLNKPEQNEKRIIHNFFRFVANIQRR